MSDVAIQVRGLGKRYTIGGGDRRPGRTLRESISDALAFRGRRAAAAGPPDRSFWALKDVDFTVRRGEVVGIIGRNGAGKSTLLKVLSRITEPTEGGADINGRVGSLLEVGTGFHPELTGRENVFLNGAILGMRRTDIARRFDEIVAFAGTERFLDTPVKYYSSGMYTRLAFAVAAHLEPEVLIVDEVLAVGDAAFQRKCMGKMRDVAEGGRTVLFVSHQMAAVQQLCGRVVLLRGGRVEAEGEPLDVIGRYLGDATEASDGTFDLSDHPARGRQHRPVVRRAALSTGGDAGPTAHFYPDDPLVVELSLDASEPIRDARVAVAIEDATNRRIVTLASYFGGGSLGDLTGERVVRCRLDRLRLGAGRYLISVSVADKYRGLIDSVDAAGWFEVGWRNNFGNGEPYNAVYGPVLSDSRWDVVGATPDR